MIILIFTFSSIFLFAEEGKLEMFYSNDSLLNVSFENNTGIEKSNEKEIFDLIDLSSNYQGFCEIKLNRISGFLEDNIYFLELFFNQLIDENNKNSIKRYKLIRNDLFPELNQNFISLKKITEDYFFNMECCVRVMWSYEREQVFVLGREITPGIYALTGDWPEHGLVFWSKYFFDSDYSPDNNTEHIRLGKMDYPYWFYETNLKIRIVKQVNDSKGNYLGEIAIDFYKFDNYDVLFPNSDSSK